MCDIPCGLEGPLFAGVGMEGMGGWRDGGDGGVEADNNVFTSFNTYLVSNYFNHLKNIINLQVASCWDLQLYHCTAYW